MTHGRGGNVVAVTDVKATTSVATIMVRYTALGTARRLPKRFLHFRTGPTKKHMLPMESKFPNLPEL